MRFISWLLEVTQLVVICNTGNRKLVEQTRRGHRNCTLGPRLITVIRLSSLAIVKPTVVTIRAALDGEVSEAGSAQEFCAI